jgi:hypothetical protein
VSVEFTLSVVAPSGKAKAGPYLIWPDSRYVFDGTKTGPWTVGLKMRRGRGQLWLLMLLGARALHRARA